MLVVDASRTLSLCLDDERDDAVLRLVDRLAVEDAIAPAIWALEMANGLCSAIRRGRLAPHDLPRLRQLISRLPIDLEPTPVTEATGAILDLAIRHDLSAYDAAYLDLASRTGAMMATGDDRLRAACRAAGVQLLD
jgi:predicted nucleic acid-binding protein